MKRRSYSHDYNAPGIYMLTIATEGRRPLLGRLAITPEPHVELSPLGQTLLSDEFPKISHHYPMVRVWKICIMPDHIHFIINISQKLPEGKHLGIVVRGFKSGCTRAYRAVTGRSDSLFEEGYNDRLLYHHGQLNNWKAYIADNPRRLAMKRAHPDLFTVLTDIDIAGRKCQIVGNRFLLDIPDKMAVIVHHSYDKATYERYREAWLACGERGGVLVSAAVAPPEKAVMREAMNRGYCIILLRENGFAPLYKPSGESFDACAEGRLLQISPWTYHTDRRTITRDQCLYLNSLAEAIAAQQ